ncbi:extracellular solute-binding protein [Oceanobacillus sp. CFH 90083]|uniref:sugar ABC transporter substrate-binding protein n=1 Tax=Oceanobacillus sp. CFH 90083 TaxID=2592336 RepID=UPI00128C667E|nr:extracellular solute-binding protein [Oceanobacillus sp. CFH 90083]
MLKNNLFFGLSMFCLIILLSACGPQRDNVEVEEGTVNDEIPEKPEELNVWAWDNVLEPLKMLAEKYTEETGIKVNVIVGDNANLTLDAPAGKGPDIYYETHDRMGERYVQGVVSELTLTDEQLSGYQESALEGFTYEGELLGIPSSLETIGLLYNKSLIPEAPETVEELNNYAEELTNPSNDEYGFLTITSDFYFMYPFLTSGNGYVFGEDEQGSYNTSDIGLTEDDVIQGANLVYSWHEDGFIPESINDDIMSSLFSNGQVGAITSGPWAVEGFRESLGDDLAIAPLPTYNGEHLESFLGVKGFAVSEYSENKYWATDLALFMTNAENSQTMFEDYNLIPARTDVTVDDELYEGFQEQIQFASPMPNIPEMAQVWDPMEDALVFISQGDDPKAVLEEAVDYIKAQISLMGGSN